jgi:hypothetical protein
VLLWCAGVRDSPPVPATCSAKTDGGSPSSGLPLPLPPASRLPPTSLLPASPFDDAGTFPPTADGKTACEAKATGEKLGKKGGRPLKELSHEMYFKNENVAKNVQNLAQLRDAAGF